MHTDIVFSGLCSFLNVTDTNPTMPAPSVILVRTDEAAEIPHSMHKHDAAGHVHLPFIAFDSTLIRAAASDGIVPEIIPQVPTFHFFRLNGVKVTLREVTRGQPDVRPSYHRVVRKDDYFPEARNKWNRDFVPRRDRLPRSSAVAAFLRFGEGTISAHRISKIKYRFVRNGEEVFSGRFAEEVVYRFEHPGRSVVVSLTDLTTRRKVRDIEFSLIGARDRKLTIFIGNNMPDAMSEAVQRTVRELPSVGNDHFGFLNMVASPRLVAIGPTAEPIEPPAPPANLPDDGTPILEDRPAGGSGTGFCGPSNANGAPTS